METYIICTLKVAVLFQCQLNVVTKALGGEDQTYLMWWCLGCYWAKGSDKFSSSGRSSSNCFSCPKSFQTNPTQNNHSLSQVPPVLVICFSLSDPKSPARLFKNSLHFHIFSPQSQDRVWWGYRALILPKCLSSPAHTHPYCECLDSRGHG